MYPSGNTAVPTGRHCKGGTHALRESRATAGSQRNPGHFPRQGKQERRSERYFTNSSK